MKIIKFQWKIISFLYYMQKEAKIELYQHCDVIWVPFYLRINWI